MRNERYLETQAQRRRREEEKEREAQQQLLQELQEKLKKEAEILVRAFDEDDSEDDEVYSQVYKEDYAHRIAPGVSFEAMLASPPASHGDKRVGEPNFAHPGEEHTVDFHQQRRSEHEEGREIFSRIREKDRARRERLKRLEEEASSTREEPTAGDTNSNEHQVRGEWLAGPGQVLPLGKTKMQSYRICCTIHLPPDCFPSVPIKAARLWSAEYCTPGLKADNEFGIRRGRRKRPCAGNAKKERFAKPLSGRYVPSIHLIEEA